MAHTDSLSPAQAPAALSQRDQRGNIARLTLAQALAGANSVVVYATGAIIGHALAPAKTLATLPILAFVVGMAASILPAGAIARRYGRRVAFLGGAACGVLVGLLAAVAVVLSFRFAAADGVAPPMRARALSFVMGGGVAAGVIGPQLVTHTMQLWPLHLFAATYLAQAGAAVLSAFVLAGVRLPLPSREFAASGRPLREIARQPAFITAAICGAVSYMLMNFLMTAAPLAMHLCGHSQEDSNLGLQWHVIAMYLPSFFTGRLIGRYGARRVVACGLALTAVSAAVGLTGIEVSRFWLTLTLLGVGWNFGFVGASALVLDCHRPEEKTSVQSLNDFLVFSTMAVGSFASGGLLSAYGWNTVLWISFLPVAIAGAALLWSARR